MKIDNAIVLLNDVSTYTGITGCHICFPTKREYEEMENTGEGLDLLMGGKLEITPSVEVIIRQHWRLSDS